MSLFHEWMRKSTSCRLFWVWVFFGVFLINDTAMDACFVGDDFEFELDNDATAADADALEALAGK